jgi:hypothetical protein
MTLTPSAARPLLAVGLAVALATGACTSSGEDSSAEPGPSTAPATLDPGPTCVQDEQGEKCLPLAPKARRVDLVKPTFSKPTSITNPLFPVTEVDQYVQLGTVEDGRFRSEITVLPGTKTIEWNGQRVETVVSQYLAFADGRILEVALDWYAQADDGAVWYFGEDVFNYEDGVVADTEGTWVAGKDGPAGMIMPGNPSEGQVYRPENAPGIVFEEVTVRSVDKTVDGPRGQVEGAMVGRELHADGSVEDKTFAPGYGEFYTSAGGEVEALAVAVPTDAVSGPVPAELGEISTAALAAFDAAGRGDWAGVAGAGRTAQQAWTDHRPTGVPPLLDKEMTRAMGVLTGAVADREPEEVRQAALDVAHANLDLRLRHEPVVTIDLARLGLWARQLALDAAAREPGDIAGDAATLTWIWDRVRHAVDSTAADRVDVAAAAAAAPTLLATLTAVTPR